MLINSRSKIKKITPNNILLKFLSYVVFFVALKRLTKTQLYRKNSEIIVKKTVIKVNTDESHKISKTSHDRLKRSAPTYFTHWKYLHYHNRALSRAKNFVLVLL